MSNLLGDKYRLMIFGQSRAPMSGGVIEGVPAGIAPDMDFINAFMARRAPGGALSTKRREADVPEIIAGLNERGETCGASCVSRGRGTKRRDFSRWRDRMSRRRRLRRPLKGWHGVCNEGGVVNERRKT